MEKARKEQSVKEARKKHEKSTKSEKQPGRRF